MAISITKNLSLNPRGARDLGQPNAANNRFASWNEIMEADTSNCRVQIYNLEGDFPKPSSNTYDKGVLQYYYFGGAGETYSGHLRTSAWIYAPYTFASSDGGVIEPSRQLGYSSNYTINAPNNFNWEAEILIDEEKRDMQNLSQTELMRYDITFTASSWSPTASNRNIPDNSTANFGSRYSWRVEMEDKLDQVDTFPKLFKFTTNPRRAFVDDTYFYMQPGASCTITWNLQDSFIFDGKPPNEDKNYLSVTDNDASWELGSPVDVSSTSGPGGTTYTTSSRFNSDGESDLTWKPLENGNLQTSKVRAIWTNKQINEEPWSDWYNETLAGGSWTATVAHTNSVFQRNPFFVQLYADILGDIRQQISETDGLIEFYDNIERTMSNPNNLPMNVGYPSIGVWKAESPEVKHFWSAGYVSLRLSSSGFPALRTQSALDYVHYGREINWRSWKDVRKCDIAVFKFKNASGGHVGFITEVDLSTNKVKIAGGNQGNKAKESEYYIDNVDMYLLTVRRNWEDPGDDYKLL